MKTMLFLYTLFLFTSLTLGNELRITNESEFSSFVDNVNTGVSNYSRFTVYLDSDLSLSEINEFIGDNSSSSYYFLGTFDGQGHIISDLNINSPSSSIVGLFRYSEGLTIRNVILDSSCSIINSYKDYSSSYAGGIIGRCYSSKGQCVIENTVNMATVTFNGDTEHSYLYLGGIIGYFYSLSYNSTVRNCVNYGEITHSGTSRYSYIGGIVGGVGGSNFYYIYIQNCLNYGTITYNSTSSYSLYLGGIIGNTRYTHIENCVSAGKINTTSSKVIGSIVGYVGSNTTINSCYFTEELSSYDINGNGTNINMLNTPMNSIDVNLILLSNLNTYSLNNGWNKWLLNINNETVSFIINNKKNNLTVNSQIILLFDIIDNDNKRNFSGWYNDKNLTSPFDSSEVNTDIILYSMFCYSNYTVTLDVNGGDNSSLPSSHPMAIECNGVYGTLPTPAREGYTFTGWFTEKENGKGEKIESGNNVANMSDHTLYAHWNANNYTVTFNPTGGNVNISSKNVIYYSIYGDLPFPTKDDYYFVGWFTINNESVTNETIVNISDDHTLYAQWEKIIINKKSSSSDKSEVQTIYVEIIFSTKDLTKDLTKNEIKSIVKQHTDGDENFEIVEFDRSSDGIRVIIKFKDIEKAENFVDNIKGSSEALINNYIKKVNFIPESVVSYSYSILFPLLLFIVLIV